MSSLQYKLFQIANSQERTMSQPVYPDNLPEEYKRLSETDKLVYETLVKDCYAAAYSGEKFIKIPERVSQDVLVALGIPKKAAIFYWDTPGTNNL